MTRALLLLAAVALLVACGGTTTKPAAKVGSDEISTVRLAQFVDYFQEEAKKEGELVPKPGTADFENFRRRVLDRLVYWSQLEQKASALGVQVSDREVEERLALSGDEAESIADRDALAQFVRVNLLQEKLYAKVTAGIPAKDAAKAWQRLVAAFPREFPVTYYK